MSEQHDPLLRALGEVERDYDERYPAVWEDVLAGRRAASEAEARAGVDPPEEHAQFAAMFGAKIGEDEVERLVGRASAALGAEVAAAPAPAAEVVPMRRRVQVAVVAILAVAAALVLWQLPREGPRGTPVAYSLTVRNRTVEPVRSTDTAPAVGRYRPDSEVDWVLSPEQTQAAAVTLEVVAREAGGREVTARPAFTRSQAGALRVTGRLSEVIGLTPGRWRLRFVIAAEGAAAVETSLEIEVIAGD